MQDDRLDAAFEAWLQAQTAALDVVRHATGVPESDVDLAEGYRWVTRLTRLILDWIVEKSDPLHPQLFDLQDEYKKLLVDNPDVHYTFCVLDDSRTYRLLGHRGDCAYLGMTFGTAFGQGPVGGRTGTQTQTHIDEFELGPGGEVDILIAPAASMPDPRPRNAVLLEPGTAQLAIRETYFEKHPDRFARLRVELVPEPGEVVPHPILSTDELAPKLEFAAMFLTFVGGTAMQMWRDAGTNMNTFGGTGRFGPCGGAGGRGAFPLQRRDDVPRRPVRARAGPGAGRDGARARQALPLLGAHAHLAVEESFDYRYATTHLNNKTATRSADGSWRMVIAPTDPGVENWLDTGGRLQGYMLVRWVLADGPPHPTAEVVDSKDLAGSSRHRPGAACSREIVQLGRLGTSWISQPLPSGSLKERNVS